MYNRDYQCDTSKRPSLGLYMVNSIGVSTAPSFTLFNNESEQESFHFTFIVKCEYIL